MRIYTPWHDVEDGLFDKSPGQWSGVRDPQAEFSLQSGLLLLLAKSILALLPEELTPMA